MAASKVSIERLAGFKAYSLDSTLADTPEIPYSSVAGGNIFLGTTTAITLTFYAAPNLGGTYVALRDSANMPVTRTVAQNLCYAVPDECYGAGAIKIVPDAEPCPITFSFKG